MSRSRHAVGVLLVTLFGLWGCSRAPSADGSTGHRREAQGRRDQAGPAGRRLPGRRQRRDQLSKRLMAAEEARTALQAQTTGWART